jgi:hypothetical protein
VEFLRVSKSVPLPDSDARQPDLEICVGMRFASLSRDDGREDLGAVRQTGMPGLGCWWGAGIIVIGREEQGIKRERFLAKGLEPDLMFIHSYLQIIKMLPVHATFAAHP